jgi:hypothetical protein
MRAAVRWLNDFQLLTKLLIGVDFTFPLAEFVCSTIRTGPNES